MQEFQMKFSVASKAGEESKATGSKKWQDEPEPDTAIRYKKWREKFLVSYCGDEKIATSFQKMQLGKSSRNIRSHR